MSTMTESKTVDWSTVIPGETEVVVVENSRRSTPAVIEWLTHDGVVLRGHTLAPYPYTIIELP